MIRTIMAAALLCAFVFPAQARKLNRTTGLHPMCNITMPCELPYVSSARTTRETRGRYIAREVGIGGPRARVSVKRRPSRRPSSFVAPPSFVGSVREVAAAIVAHPAGCPSRAFCGCGAAVRVFGYPVRELWLAANWFKFPRTSPGPGMVAVRRHHVFVLEQPLGGNTWLAYDANSGRHATRIHARSIAGYTIVNPRGAG